MRDIKFRIYFKDEEPFMTEPISLEDLLHEDYIEQFNRSEYLLILNNRVIVKAKLTCILDFNENLIHGYKVQTNRVKRYIDDLIQAGLVEKVEEER